MTHLSFIWPLVSAIAISSIAAIISLGLTKLPKLLTHSVPALVALAAGSMLSTALLHLLPESMEFLSPDRALVITLTTFVLFFFVERVLQWHHCHDGECPEHFSMGYINLFGDALHNFLDGIVIAVAWSASPSLGIAATLAIAAHEIPQEIGDFGILIHAGWPVHRALLANVSAAGTVILGTLLGLPLLQQFPGLNPLLLAAAAGSFLYLATVDLVPELHRRLSGGQSLIIGALFVTGILMIPTLAAVLPDTHQHAEHETPGVEQPHSREHMHEAEAADADEAEHAAEAQEVHVHEANDADHDPHSENEAH